jgi:D-2-hydroxyacid dehydrogenase (NADP+)
MRTCQIKIAVMVDPNRNMVIVEMIKASLADRGLGVDVFPCTSADHLRIINPEVIVGHQTEDVMNYLTSSGDSLKWLHVLTSGVDVLANWLNLADNAHNFRVSCSRGVHGIAMQEYVLSMMLFYAKNIPQWQERKKYREWSRQPLSMLFNSQVLIFGTGEIGREVARLCKFLEMRVEGVSRSGRKVDFFDLVFPQERLLCRVPFVDYIVIAAPLTKETKGVFNHEVFHNIKKGCVLINISRGGIIDENALISSLQSGRLKGAALDAFSEEPLPDDSPLWAIDNLIITPHISGISPVGLVRAIEIFSYNFDCWLNNESLPTEVFLERGY